MQFKAEHDAAVRQNESLELYALCGNGNGKYDYNYKYCISSTNSRTQEKKKIKKTRSGKTSRRTCDACEHKNKNAQRKVRKLCRRIAYNGRSIYTKAPLPPYTQYIYIYLYFEWGGKIIQKCECNFRFIKEFNVSIMLCIIILYQSQDKFLVQCNSHVRHFLWPWIMQTESERRLEFGVWSMECGVWAVG